MKIHQEILIRLPFSLLSSAKKEKRKKNEKGFAAKQHERHEEARVEKKERKAPCDKLKAAAEAAWEGCGTRAGSCTRRGAKLEGRSPTEEEAAGLDGMDGMVAEVNVGRKGMLEVAVCGVTCFDG